jgi:hypothetical protein
MCVNSSPRRRDASTWSEDWEAGLLNDSSKAKTRTPGLPCSPYRAAPFTPTQSPPVAVAPEGEEREPECPKNCPPADIAHETFAFPSREFTDGLQQFLAELKTALAYHVTTEHWRLEKDYRLLRSGGLWRGKISVGRDPHNPPKWLEIPEYPSQHLIRTSQQSVGE